MKRFFSVGVVAFFLLLAGVLAQAQVLGTVRGKVVDEKDDQAIQGAKLEFESLENGTILTAKSNKKGAFIQLLTSTGRFRFKVSKEGYFDFEDKNLVLRGESEYDLGVIRLRQAVSSTGTVLDHAAKERELAVQKMAAQAKKDFDSAVELTKLGQYPEAVATYKRILETAPLLPEVHFNLGVVYLRQNDWANAQAEFEKVLELDPELAETYLALSEVYLTSGQIEKAGQFLTTAVAKYPDNVALQYNLGLACFNSNKYPEAKQAFIKVSQLDPARAEAYYYIGTLLVSENKITEAVENLEKYLSMTPTNPQNAQTARDLLAALKKPNRK